MHERESSFEECGYTMTFDPQRAYVLTSTITSGLSGKGSRLTIRFSGRNYMASSVLDKLEYSRPVSRKNAMALLGALNNIDFSSLPQEDGSRGNDLSIWSVLLVQGASEWKWGTRTDVSLSPPLDALRSALTAIAVDLKSS